MKWLKKLSNYWTRLNRREQRLAIIVGALVALVLVLTALNSAMMRLEELNRQIVLLEDGIESSALQIKVREAVEEAYEEVAGQHSSTWTEAQILDRLRDEVYRLAQVQPSPLDEQGVPEQVENESGQLIGRPQLGEGSLEEREEGYREYKIRVRIENEPFPAFVDYLERLQMSPQSLRIDGLDLRRSILSNRVTASLDITRIIVDRHESEWKQVPYGPEAWMSHGCRVSEDRLLSGRSGSAALLEPAGPRGVAYLKMNLEPAATYDMRFIAMAEGPAQVVVYNEATGANLKGSLALEADGEFHAYEIRFTLPPAEDQKASVRAPLINLEDLGSRVILGDVAVLRRRA
ncbi:MAG: hypothetical protein ACLFTT_01340 [Candidatus Hydrogenedentota bacterium]